jgi:hypothetical protein
MNGFGHAIFELGFWGSSPVHAALLTGAVVSIVFGAVDVFTVLRVDERILVVAGSTVTGDPMGVGAR